ncbi:hypothetical protein A2W14_04050 [Candidatus Gottesmanbacteria bacterium RBG_16_37_8]|uniref:Uncharacterized protein n=1 Tax=Candidatus Gottesmanbacteria bacterium RBG_16_37_8 TaxID=1798371 RepID=A0A1F5YU12_9BACT|nr:MAG: hypothetical protein A2W14_04050 [Candidatus Gottesmanbacteria bacterium RBG_16_37_8]
MPDLESRERLVGNPSNEDHLTSGKTLYDASAFEIFWRNFLAGSSRTLGGIIFYLIFILIIGSIFIRYLTPVISPIFNQLNSISGSLEKIPRLPSF